MGYYVGKAPSITDIPEVETLLKTNSFVALNEYTKPCECGYGYMVKEICNDGNRFFCIGCDNTYFEERIKPGVPKNRIPPSGGSNADRSNCYSIKPTGSAHVLKPGDKCDNTIVMGPEGNLWTGPRLTIGPNGSIISEEDGDGFYKYFKPFSTSAEDYYKSEEDLTDKLLE